VSDHSLENAVMQALAGNRRVHADEIAVQAIDGAVILRGTVGSLVQQVEAARTARRVMGVQTVQDQLQVRPTGPEGRADADTRASRGGNRQQRPCRGAPALEAHGFQ